MVESDQSIQKKVMLLKAKLEHKLKKEVLVLSRNRRVAVKLESGVSLLSIFDNGHNSDAYRFQISESRSRERLCVYNGRRC